MTNLTRCISVTSTSGFPATAMMSAKVLRSGLTVWLRAETSAPARSVDLQLESAADPRQLTLPS